MLHLILFSRPGCHLCEDMKATIDRVSDSVALTLEVVDISEDTQLEAQYGLEIPVLLVNGQKAAKYRVSEEDLRGLLAGRRHKEEGKSEV